MKKGMTWKGWTIGDLIGEGSFGKVYRIYREDYGRGYESALKVIRIPQSKAEENAVRSEVMNDEDVRAYFLSSVESIIDEISFMSRLRGNSNIVSYEDHSVDELFGEFGWRICIRMELLTPLLRYIRMYPVTTGDVVRMGIDICRALETCEKNQIIHRDIKPENIFRSAQGFYKLGDFGIARQMEKSTAGMSKKGTYSYMAPEVVKGELYDHTADIYSLGVVLYRFLNNNRGPFLPHYPDKIYYDDKEKANDQRLNGAPMEPPCNADPKAGEVILRACSFRPEDRYQSAEEFRRALESALTEEMDQRPAIPGRQDKAGELPEETDTMPIPTPMSMEQGMSADGPSHTNRKAAKKRLLRAALAVLTAIVLLGGTVFCGKLIKGDVPGVHSWKAAYLKVLKKHESDIRECEVWSPRFGEIGEKSTALCDLNKDGTPELLFFDSSEGSGLRIFTFRRGKEQEMYYRLEELFSSEETDNDTNTEMSDSAMIFKTKDKGCVACFVSDAESYDRCFMRIILDEKTQETEEFLYTYYIGTDETDSAPSYYRNEKKITRKEFGNRAREMTDQIDKVLFASNEERYKAYAKKDPMLPEFSGIDNVSMCFDDAVETLGGRSAETIKAYRPVLNEYYQIIQNSDSLKLNELLEWIEEGTYHNISKHFAIYLKGTVYDTIVFGYALMDIDGNGTEELIIRWNENGGQAVYGLDKNRRPRLLVDSESMSLYRDGKIVDFYDVDKEDFFGRYDGLYQLDVSDDYNQRYEHDVYTIMDGSKAILKDSVFKFYDSYGNGTEDICFRGDREISEKQYDKLLEKITDGPELKLNWIDLKKKNNYWQ